MNIAVFSKFPASQLGMGGAAWPGAKNYQYEETNNVKSQNSPKTWEDPEDAREGKDVS